MKLFFLLGRVEERGLLQYAIEKGPLSNNNYDAFSHWTYIGNVFFFLIFFFPLSRCPFLQLASSEMASSMEYITHKVPQFNSSKISCPQHY
jgi:hypothetical protein